MRIPTELLDNKKSIYSLQKVWDPTRHRLIPSNNFDPLSHKNKLMKSTFELALRNKEVWGSELSAAWAASNIFVSMAVVRTRLYSSIVNTAKRVDIRSMFHK